MAGPSAERQDPWRRRPTTTTSGAILAAQMLPHSDEDWRVFYRSLSTTQLLDVAAHIDRDHLLLRASIVDEELRARQITDSPVIHAKNHFDQQLEQLSRWRLLLFCAWAGGIPSEMIIGGPLSSYVHSTWPFLVIAIAVLGTFGYAGIQLDLFVCPRCGERYTSKHFFGPFRYSNPFASRCVHCGLARSSS
jgi:hypothetical protein